MDEKQYAWSFDDEDYNHGIFNSFEEALEEAKLSNWTVNDEDRVKYAFIGELEDAEYEGWKIDSEDIIEQMQQDAYEEHESAEDWLEYVPKEHQKELSQEINGVIGSWLTKYNLHFKYYSIVNKKNYDIEIGEEVV